MHRTAIALGILAVATTSTVSAQRFILRTPPVLKSELTVGTRILAPTTVGIDNVGLISGPPSGEGFMYYNDAQFLPDGYAGNDDNGTTYFFAFNSAQQIVDAEGRPMIDGDYILATHMSAIPIESERLATTGISREDDTGPAMGWELQYARYLTNKKRFGFLVAFGVNGVDSSVTENLKYQQTYEGYLHLIERGEGSGSFAPDRGYGGRLGPPVIITPGVLDIQAHINPVDPDNPLYQYTIEGDGTGKWDLRTGLYTFRLGGFYNLDVSRRFDLRVGAGLAAIVVDSYFDWSLATRPSEDMPIADRLNPSGASGEHRERDILLGGWADVGASYQINSRVQFFGSVEYTSAEEFSQSVSGVGSATIDTSKMVNARTGFSFAF